MILLGSPLRNRSKISIRRPAIRGNPGLPLCSALPAGAASEDAPLRRREQIPRRAIAWHRTHRAKVNEGCRTSGALHRPSERRPSVRAKLQGDLVDFFGGRAFRPGILETSHGPAVEELDLKTCPRLRIHVPKNSTAADNSCFTQLPCAKPQAALSACRKKWKWCLF